MNDEQKIDIGVRYATEWYTYHAGQRMTAVRFYLAIIGALLISYVQTQGSHPAWAFTIALFGAVVSFVFWVLDVRNTELVTCGRVALDHLEQELNLRIRADDRERRHLRDVSLVASLTLNRVNSRWDRIWKFQCWLRVLYGVVFICSIALATSAWRIPAPWPE